MQATDILERVKNISSDDSKVKFVRRKTAVSIAQTNSLVVILGVEGAHEGGEKSGSRRLLAVEPCHYRACLPLINGRYLGLCVFPLHFSGCNDSKPPYTRYLPRCQRSSDGLRGFVDRRAVHFLITLCQYVAYIPRSRPSARGGAARKFFALLWPVLVIYPRRRSRIMFQIP